MGSWYNLIYKYVPPISVDDKNLDRVRMLGGGLFKQ